MIGASCALALDRPPSEALALRPLDAVRRLARRELRRLRELARAAGASEAALAHSVAFNGLAGGLPLLGLRETLVDELGRIGRTADADAIASLLQQELPPPGKEAAEPGVAVPAPERLGTIQPDLIGEGVILEALSGEPAVEAAAAGVAARAYGLTRGRAAAALMRLAQDFAYALEDRTADEDEVKTARPTMDWIAHLAETLADRRTLSRSLRRCRSTPPFCAKPRRRSPVAQPDALTPAFALSLNNLANGLRDVGRPEDALATGEEAISLYRGFVTV